MVSPEEDGYKCQPHDTSWIHCESNVFSLVEVFRDFPEIELNKVYKNHETFVLILTKYAKELYNLR